MLLNLFIQNEPIFNQNYKCDLIVYFNNFESKYREVMFEEFPDLWLFQHAGTDKNGIDLWIRLRVSNTCKNAHHKMKG